MKDYQRSYIQFCLDHQVLQFGQFTLKSGRLSPYFFNTGKLYTAGTLSKLAEFYAQAILDRTPTLPTVLFGPAYKGIPLCVATSLQLYQHGHVTSYCFNRKEMKDHGEKGSLVGTPLLPLEPILVIDDVITSGQAIREVWPYLQGLNVIGIQVALDRQERGPGMSQVSAIQQVKVDLGVDVYAIVTLTDILTYLMEKKGYEKECDSIRTYLAQYGVVSGHE